MVDFDPDNRIESLVKLKTEVCRIKLFEIHVISQRKSLIEHHLNTVNIWFSHKNFGKN